MDNQVNNTFNPVGLVGGVKKEGISDENTNKMLGILTENNEILKKIEDSIIVLSESLNKKVETINLESVMPTPVNAPEEQVEQPIVAPAEPIEENDLNKTEDLSDLSAQLENVNVMSEPQTVENVPETNTIDLSAPVEVPNPTQEEGTSNIESAVELANLVANEPVAETTPVDDSIIPINLEELVKADTEPNFVQPEVSQIQDNIDVAENNVPEVAPVVPEMPVAQEQLVQPQVVEPVVASPAPVAPVVPEMPVAQEQPVQPQVVEPAVAAPAPVAPVVPEMPVAQEQPVQPQVVEPVVAAPAPVAPVVPEMPVAQEQPVQPRVVEPVVAAPAPAAPVVPEMPVAQEQPAAEPIDNIEKVTGVVIQAAFGEGKQRSEVVSQEQQENLKKEVVSKTLTNTMPSMANAA